MAILLEFFNLLLPVSAIEKKFGEKVKEPLKLFRHWKTDGRLLRYGAMNMMDIERMIRLLEFGLGLRGLREVRGRKRWQDFCVVDELTGLSYPCSWIQVDDKTGLASLREKKAPQKKAKARGR